MCFFVFFMMVITFGLKKKILVLALSITLVITVLLLYKHIKKIIVLQYVLAFVAFIMLVPKLYLNSFQTHGWMNHTDDIEQVVFKKRPNIYFIQPDGYVNFSELKNRIYNFDNSQFEEYIDNKNFEIYDRFKSNYSSTLYSNSSIFAMKHHYYGDQTNRGSYDYRKRIVGKNDVLSVFDKNDYKTHLLLDQPYFLLNRAELAYDYCNINYNDIPHFSRGFDMGSDLNEELKILINNNKKSSNFYFLQKILPAHIVNFERKSEGVAKERLNYLEKLKEANEWLKKIINTIDSNDPNNLIIISADHGGYVGFKSMASASTKTKDEHLINSVFSSVLAIKWPDNDVPIYDDSLKTSVNLFRVVFSYLSDNDTYLQNLQDDKSYLIIEEGAPNGVYEVINEQGSVIFDPHEK
jgi:hypothetical protein